jgi:peptide/nickel transport system substrate-binding protein
MLFNSVGLGSSQIHKLQAEIARPIIYYGRAAGCWQPQVKNVTLHITSIYNNWRFEDVWLER